MAQVVAGTAGVMGVAAGAAVVPGVGGVATAVAVDALTVAAGTALAGHGAVKAGNGIGELYKYEIGQKIDLDRFSDRQSKSGQRGVHRDPKTGEYLEKDRNNNPHGGSHWKLKDKKGNRIATISEDGKILRE